MALSAFADGSDASHFAGLVATMKVHSGDPGSNGTANTTTAGAQSVTATASGAVVTIPAASFTGGAANGAATYVSLWDASSNYLGDSGPFTGASAFDGSGDLSVGSFTITFS